MAETCTDHREVDKDITKRIKHFCRELQSMDTEQSTRYNTLQSSLSTKNNHRVTTTLGC